MIIYIVVHCHLRNLLKRLDLWHISFLMMFMSTKLVVIFYCSFCRSDYSSIAIWNPSLHAFLDFWQSRYTSSFSYILLLTCFTSNYVVILALWFVAAPVKCQYTITDTRGNYLRELEEDFHGDARRWRRMSKKRERATNCAVYARVKWTTPGNPCTWIVECLNDLQKWTEGVPSTLESIMTSKCNEWSTCCYYRLTTCRRVECCLALKPRWS
jgi:hypothetical protein